LPKKGKTILTHKDFLYILDALSSPILPLFIGARKKWHRLKNKTAPTFAFLTLSLATTRGPKREK